LLVEPTIPVLNNWSPFKLSINSLSAFKLAMELIRL
jgi:hypothetical protein